MFLQQKLFIFELHCYLKKKTCCHGRYRPERTQNRQGKIRDPSLNELYNRVGKGNLGILSLSWPTKTFNWRLVEVERFKQCKWHFLSPLQSYFWAIWAQQSSNTTGLVLYNVKVHAIYPAVGLFECIVLSSPGNGNSANNTVFLH